MKISVISLFPKMFEPILNYGIIRQGIKKKLLKLNFWNPKDFTKYKKYRTDEAIYGGGGIILRPEPLIEAICAAKKELNNIQTIYLSPQGKVINITYINSLLKKDIILVCGRYKGIDERVIKHYIDEEVSIGDYILSGGELPAMIIIDIITRLIPGVLNNIQSNRTDSFYNNGFLDCPNYTRPKNIKYLQDIPPILLSGNHKKIKEWRLKHSLGNTWLKRPDLLKNKKLTDTEIYLLNNFKKKFLNYE
ncbi:tRNA (guanosine(37)-N1)-methyltransferase TrmD [Enterobacteriaceae endosymbiont of Neohaemonia nigricornis]|uniref:tRNA (guanosine(37)-N1)-methyltransferase TrmD n=1 Tax=Enterobacteriaceae endosymbiont of Neohaemonia nigricornis TaxID=2675792 RepID=UPI00144922FE|nr:tRNA (guanosine(37)-N1)-methyltransferase TrmD [Enterobacteriaceae endosymbiont of Neohaemonia nigricornis]QJC30632.1 tRNA (guanosine(37)-N1)-methyltransferase TrmD [Enterobacteriaceae endosymbiont of Neohaemonia nigricornis]